MVKKIEKKKSTLRIKKKLDSYSNGLMYQNIGAKVKFHWGKGIITQGQMCKILGAPVTKTQGQMCQGETNKYLIK